MAFELHCTNCRQLIRAEQGHLGKVILCPNCGTSLKVPDAPTAPPARGRMPSDMSDSVIIKAAQLMKTMRGGGKRRSFSPILIGLIPTVILVCVFVFYLMPKWQKQMSDRKEPQVETVVEKRYMYDGTEYTAEQLRAIGIDPKTGKRIPGTGPAEEAKPPHAPGDAREGAPGEVVSREKKAEEEKTSATDSWEWKAPQEQVAEAKAEAERAKPVPGLLAYHDDVKPVNDLIDAMKYEDARSRANLLKPKYRELIEIKLKNVAAIQSLHRRCIERVNSGAAKVSMGDLSRRYAFAGPIEKVDDTGLTSRIKKRWDSLSKEEIANFYRKAADPESVEALMGIAAYLMEGDIGDTGLNAALVPLGKAAENGVDVSAHLTYIETLKRADREYAQAEKGKSAAEGTAEPEAVARVEPSAAPKAEALAPSGPDTKAKVEPSYDEVYVTTAATGEQIPHPLSRKTYRIIYKGKRVEVPERMVFVPAGPFFMGEGPSEHEVYLDGYFIGKYEVTNAEWKAFMEATGFGPPPAYWHYGEIPKGKENHPVLRRSWEDAQKYCEWSGNRLPTEAEWEKAASWNAEKRVKQLYPWGDEWDAELCNNGYGLEKFGFHPDDERIWGTLWQEFSQTNAYKSLIEFGGNTTPVGNFKNVRSLYGCYDTAGNASEWCSDWYMEEYHLLKDANANPQGPSEEEADAIECLDTKVKMRVVRGGSWQSNSSTCSALNRDHVPPSGRYGRCGFRVAQPYERKRK